jgi:phosphoenolpyruvate carboxykinase (GTP)
MLPFCGYNMADHWGHWLTFADRMDPEKLPRFFYVNWFRKSPEGKFLWPGYGDNSRVLEWIFDRCAGGGEAVKSPIGFLPAEGAINVDGLSVDSAGMSELLRVDVDEWKKEVPAIREYFATFGGHVPPALDQELDALAARLEES